MKRIINNLNQVLYMISVNRRRRQSVKSNNKKQWRMRLNNRNSLIWTDMADFGSGNIIAIRRIDKYLMVLFIFLLIYYINILNLKNVLKC